MKVNRRDLERAAAAGDIAPRNAPTNVIPDRMSDVELAGCLRMVVGYWPGDWPEDRVALWADALRTIDVADAMAAIKAMSKVERWPTVAALQQFLTPTSSAEYFAPGSGVLALHVAPDPPADEVRAAGIEALRSIRTRLQGEADG